MLLYATHGHAPGDDCSVKVGSEIALTVVRRIRQGIPHLHDAL